MCLPGGYFTPINNPTEITGDLGSHLFFEQTSPPTETKQRACEKAVRRFFSSCFWLADASLAWEADGGKQQVLVAKSPFLGGKKLRVIYSKLT